MTEVAKKVLVTGGAGYLGSHTSVALAAAGYLPVVVDNFCASDRRIIPRMQRLIGCEFPVHEVDCRDRERLAAAFAREAPLYGVIHFAAHKSVGVSVREPREYYANNVGSLLTLLEVMEASAVERLVFSSSCTVYGQPESLPVTEASPLIGELPLGKPETLVPYITQAAAGLREPLTIFGRDYPTRDGTCVRDYVHISDLAAAHVRAFEWLEQRARRSCFEVFNVGTGRGVSVLEAIRAFENAAKMPFPYRFGPRRPGDAAEVYASADKAERELGWKSKLGIEEAMCDAWRWQLAISNGL